MPSPTYTLIASNTLGASAASVTFSSIPSTYTDLVLKVSMRSDRSGVAVDGSRITFNSNATNYSATYLTGSGSAATSGNYSAAGYANGGTIDASTATANTFANAEYYIPNYAGSTNKVMSTFNGSENNTTAADLTLAASLWLDTSAITSLTIVPAVGPNFVSGSSFYLYGIKNS